MELTPGVSTHFKATSSGLYFAEGFTPERVYEIFKWERRCFFFRDDEGEERVWMEENVEVQDMSFNAMLREILK